MPGVALGHSLQHFRARIEGARLAQARDHLDPLPHAHAHHLPHEHTDLLELRQELLDLMRLTAEIDRRTSGKVGGGRCFGTRLTNVLQAIQQFASLGDIVVGGSQNIIACGVWSLVRMTLLVGVP